MRPLLEGVCFDPDVVLALVSADKSTYVGVFILSRIMLHTTRHGGRVVT